MGAVANVLSEVNRSPAVSSYYSDSVINLVHFGDFTPDREISFRSCVIDKLTITNSSTVRLSGCYVKELTVIGNSTSLLIDNTEIDDACFRCVCLGVNFRQVDIHKVYFRRVYFHDSILAYVTIESGSISGMVIQDSEISYVNIYDTVETDSIVVDEVSGDCNHIPGTSLNTACPDTGAFIAWKKVHLVRDHVPGVRDVGLAKLEIPATAQRVSAYGRKCRADSAKVLEITNLNGDKTYDTARSLHDLDFVYNVGDVVLPDVFFPDPEAECSPGIHFFINKADAINY